MTLSRRSGLLIALLAFCLLAACAPVVSGSSSRSATELGATPIEVTPGQTLYVATTLQLSDVGLTTDMLGTALFVRETGDRAGARATGISLSEVRVPAFFKVELESARYIERSSATGTATTLEVVMKVSVPAGSPLGQQSLRVLVESRRGGTEVAIPIRVRQSAS